jgi:diacylglycerol kinase
MNKFLKSFTYAFNGLKYCFKNELNFKVQLFFAIVTVGLGLSFSLSITEWIIILFCIGIVLSAELFNTVIEIICNKIDPNYNSTIKIIKDVSAAAVLVLSLVSAIIGLLIFIPKIFKLYA